MSHSEVTGLFSCIAQNNAEMLARTLLSQSKAELLEAIEIMPAGHLEALWSLIERFTTHFVAGIIKEQQSQQMSKEFDLNVIIKIIGCAEATSKSECPPLGFERTVSQLCSLLLIPDDATGRLREVKVAAARFMEVWWTENKAVSVVTVASLIPFLLMECLKQGAKAADFKRLWNVRGGFLLLDYQDESSALIRELVLDAFACPAFVASATGLKLLVYLLVLEKGFFLGPCLLLVQQVVGGCSAAVASNYGKIILSVWKEFAAHSETALLVKLEEALQGWVYQAMHASSAKYFTGLRALVLAFHSTTRSGPFHSMLRRVYGPILWRSVKCANAIVRAHAAVLFFDVFPLHEPEGSAEEDDALLQRQFDLLTSLLNDADHTVRLHAVVGTGQILADYWESLPTATTNNILRHLVLKLVVDSSSSSVRAAVLKTLSNLLQSQPLSHTVLKTLLPMVKNALHDSSEKVRLAYLQLLLQVSGTKAMHFYEVIELDALLDQMVADQANAALVLGYVQLLQNSFFPTSSGVQVSRCLKFIGMNETAALIFYSNLHRVVDNVGRLVKFLAILATLTLDDGASSVGVSKKTASTKSKRGRHQEEVDEPEPAVDVDEDSKNSLLLVLMVTLRGLRGVNGEDFTEESAALLAKYITADRLVAFLNEAIESEHSLEVAAEIISSVLFLLDAHADQDYFERLGYFALLEVDFLSLLEQCRNQTADAVGGGSSSPEVVGLVGLMVQLKQEDVLLNWSLKTLTEAKKQVDKKKLLSEFGSESKFAAEVVTLLAASLIDQKREAPSCASFLHLLTLTQGIVGVVIRQAQQADLEVTGSILSLLSSCAAVVSHSSRGEADHGSVDKVLRWMENEVVKKLRGGEFSPHAIGLVDVCLFFLNDLFHVTLKPEVVSKVALDWLGLIEEAVRSRSKGRDGFLRTLLSREVPVLCRLSHLLATFSPSSAPDVQQFLTCLNSAVEEAELSGSAVHEDIDKCAKNIAQRAH